MVSSEGSGCALWRAGSSGIYKNEKAFCGSVSSVDGPVWRNSDIFGHTEHGNSGKHFLSDRINATVSDVCSCMLCSDLVQLVLSAESLEQTEDGVCPADAFHGYDSGDLCESDHRPLVYRHVVIRMIRKAK